MVFGITKQIKPVGTMKTRIWKYLGKKLPNTPFSLKIFIVKILIRMLKVDGNNIVLFNELQLWIETNGRPNTSNPNYIINEINQQKL